VERPGDAVERLADRSGLIPEDGRQLVDGGQLRHAALQGAQGRGVQEARLALVGAVLVHRDRVLRLGGHQRDREAGAHRPSRLVAVALLDLVVRPGAREQLLNSTVSSATSSGCVISGNARAPSSPPS
jgi:hypothetical protein